MAEIERGFERFDGPLIEEGEEPIRISLLGDVHDEMSRELIVHYVGGVGARRSDREADRIARNSNRWSMVATGISLLALAVAVLAFARP